jgi:hypothetical protein
VSGRSHRAQGRLGESRLDTTPIGILIPLGESVMQLKEPGNRQALLLSMAVPMAGGQPAQTVAWQALVAAARTHQVDLACVAAGAVHLNHWQAMRRHARRITMLRPDLGVRLRQWLRGDRDSVLAHSLRRQIQPWVQHHDYHAVVCLDRRLWTVARHIQAPGYITGPGERWPVVVTCAQFPGAPAQPVDASLAA